MSRPPVNESAALAWDRFQQLNQVGLRSDAARVLAEFSSALTAAERAAFARWFCRQRYARPRRHQMRSHLMPLTRDVLLPALLAGTHGGDLESLRWLVNIRHDPAMRTDLLLPELHRRSRLAGLVALALLRLPNAPEVWRIGFRYELGPAEWGMHHLGEGVLILPEQECRASLDSAQAVAAAAPPGALDKSDLADLSDLNTALQDYRDWRLIDTDVSFPSWCAERGRPRSWSRAIYYGRPQ